MKYLRISMNIAHSGCKPSTIMPSFTRTFSPSLPAPSYPYNSPLPSPHFYRPTLNHPQAYAPDAQTTSICLASTPLPHSACTPKKLLKSTLRFLFFSDTPHIHLTIIRFNLSRLCTFSAFITHVSVPYANYTLDTSSVYLSLYMV